MGAKINRVENLDRTSLQVSVKKTLIVTEWKWNWNKSRIIADMKLL